MEIEMQKEIWKLVLGAAAVAAVVGVSPQAGAQVAWPTKPVKIIVPQTPGGASDALARIIGVKLSEKWGQPVVVENRAGAGGNVGMEAVAASPADGYTLLMSYVGTQAINGALYKNLPFDVAKDFAPVATLATVPFVMVSKAGAPFKSVSELADAARKGRITYGSAGNGSVNHLLGEMFSSAAGVKLVHVPYRGAAPALQDLMGGQIDVVFTSLPSVAGSIKSAQLQPIAVTSGKRSASFNTIPTIAEGGIRSFDVSPWFGLMAPGKTPADVIARINRDINEQLRTKDVADRFAAQGADVYVTTPSEFASVLAADITKWGDVVRSSGAKID
jgi:tripartite-type tricarboxylate transporter receptor subunit TctC